MTIHEKKITNDQNKNFTQTNTKICLRIAKKFNNKKNNSFDIRMQSVVLVRVDCDHNTIN